MKKGPLILSGHVEYNCNPGYDPKNPDTSKYTVAMADRRTNHFPFKDVFDLYVNKVGFLDFKHALTGGLLWKAQHPETETYYNSKHAKAGAGCDSCHAPKIKDKTGKVYTSHGNSGQLKTQTAFIILRWRGNPSQDLLTSPRRA